jgi:hypothetical protein
VRERSQSENVDPRVLRTRRWWRQESQRPKAGGIVAQDRTLQEG